MEIGVVIAVTAFIVMALTAVLVAVISAVSTVSGIKHTTDDDGKQYYICYNQSKERRSDGIF